MSASQSLHGRYIVTALLWWHLSSLIVSESTDLFGVLTVILSWWECCPSLVYYWLHFRWVRRLLQTLYLIFFKQGLHVCFASPSSLLQLLRHEAAADSYEYEEVDMQATGTKGTMDFKQNKDGSGKMHIKMHDGREFKMDVGAAHRHQLSCFTGALLILSAVNWNFQ